MLPPYSVAIERRTRDLYNGKLCYEGVLLKGFKYFGWNDMVNEGADLMNRIYHTYGGRRLGGQKVEPQAGQQAGTTQAN